VEAALDSAWAAMLDAARARAAGGGDAAGNCDGGDVRARSRKQGSEIGSIIFFHRGTYPAACGVDRSQEWVRLKYIRALASGNKSPVNKPQWTIQMTST
jgi:hypothetical protein